uniref:Ubiquitin-like protease family profile domain-containing protein n=1 Tax=Brassica oleracea TaxID=3712 RepID=A0A3P6DRF9_BRAOL|nr:unnamed protein product [Brassica oleracea]
MPATKSTKRKSHVNPPCVLDTMDVGPSTKRKKDTEHVNGCHTSETVSEKLDATIQAKVDAMVGLYKDEVMMKIAMLVEDVKNLKEKVGVNIPIDVANSNDHNSIVQEEDDASSNDLEKKKTMVKQERKTSDVKNKGKKAEVPVKKVKKEKAFVIPELNDKSISSGDWKNHLEWEKSDKCRQVMQELASTLEKVKVRRKPHLTKTQLWLFVGNSTVKRIITGVTPSTVSYDPFAKVESQKLVKVMDFVKRDLEQEESGYGEFCAQFYLKIMVPRDAWPTDKYGWLSDSHIAATMLMFHRRSIQSTSPYSSSRVAFLDRWFMKSWVNDFEKQDKKKIEVSDMYIKAFNGEYPKQFVTGKKCISSVVKEHKELTEECRPFMKMIPLVLNKMLPPNSERKKTEQQFALRRHKDAPRNDDPGDCGVYSLKYIECLAIGCTFQGLSDTIIPEQRMKLAAEIYEEVAEVDAEG